MMSKNKEMLYSFIEYCIKHPEERFWQALNNWSRFSKIEGDGTDVFYLDDDAELLPSNQKDDE